MCSYVYVLADPISKVSAVQVVRSSNMTQQGNYVARLKGLYLILFNIDVYKLFTIPIILCATIYGQRAIFTL